MACATEGNERHCSFCGRSGHDAKRLIAGPRVFICDACVELCNEILAEGPTPPSPARAASPLRRLARRALGAPARLRRLHPAEAG